MSRKDEKHRSLPEWLAVRLDVPPDLLSGGMRLDMRGRHNLTVHGCRRIAAYTPDCIRLILPRCTLAIRGERLICTSYLGGAVGIDGKIDSLSFEGKDDKADEGGDSV